MNLLVSGDSWTSGWPMENNEKAWPRLVSNKLDFLLTDVSRSASSNYRIFRKAFDKIITGEYDICIVALSNWTRFEVGATYGEKPGRIYQHIFGSSELKEDEYVYKNFFNGYKQYTDLLRQIIILDLISRTNNTECFFLDTFKNNLFFDITYDNFLEILKTNDEVYKHMDDERISKKYQVVKKLEQKIDFNKFISKKSYQEIIGNKCKFEKEHPLEDGHRMIADVIINFIKGNRYGKTI